ncbi:SgrR family transcriptional regulator [Paenibacillus gansuensis]|uniref:ABC transporter substrate-binding protein n=1 Tax=Paenibacillus gansuensis TaxID=306542 RepID=A0ABW5PBA3_9BACL
MHLALQYLDVRKHFAEAALGEKVPVTVDELSSIFFCTPRNVKIVIKKLSDADWIEWYSGRGRGNVSSLLFKQPLEDVLLEVAREEMARGQLKEALSAIEKYGEHTDAKDRFMEWLNGYFGYDSVQKHTGHIQTFRFPLYRTISTLDPCKLIYAFDGHLGRQIFDTLVVFNKQTQMIEPHLAHCWETSGDGLLWTFYLRRGVNFHHGRELTAEDVVYSFRRTLREHEGDEHLWLAGLNCITALDRHTVQFSLKRPNWLFLRYLCNIAACILPEELVEKMGPEFFLYPVGTGPFKLTKWTAQIVILDANPHYFLGRAHLDRVEIVIFPKEEIEKKQEPEWQQLICYGEFCRLPDPDWERIEEVCSGSSILTFNLRREGPMQNPKLRKAIHHLFDRNKLVTELGGERIMPAQGLYPRNLQSKEDLYFHPEEARRLLSESGYQGEPIHLYSYNKHSKDVYFIQKECAAFGIQVEVHVISWTDMSRFDYMSKADMVFFCVILEDEQVSISETYRSRNCTIANHLSPELSGEVNRILDQVPMEASGLKRQAMLDRIEALLMEHNALTFLSHSKLDTSFHPSVRGLSFNSVGWMDFRHIWIKPSFEELRTGNGTGILNSQL